MPIPDVSQWFDFSRHTAVVTGGCGALGGEMACALVEHGANVAIVDLKPPAAPLAARLQAGPGQVEVIYTSVLDREALATAGDALRARFGPAGMLLNVAGIHRDEATTSPTRAFFDLPPEALRLVLDVNLLGTLLACQVFGRDMAERGEGAIVNVSSVASFQSLTRVPAYSASKAAVDNFTRWLAVHMALEYGPRIRVNAIAPGFVLTDVNRHLLTDPTSGELTERGRTVVDHVPMRRFGQPWELVSTALWLLSPASSFVTGAVVPVDGGFSAFSGV